MQSVQLILNFTINNNENQTMNKYHGSKFEEYLKEKGTFEEISALAQKRWEELQTEELEGPSDITEDLPRGINRFFQWLRHAINNLVS